MKMKDVLYNSESFSSIYTFKHKIDNFCVKFKLWTFYDITMTSKVSFVYNWPVELGLGRNWHKDRVMTISEVSKEEIWEFFSRLFSIMKASLVTAIVLLKTSKAKIEANFFSALRNRQTVWKTRFG